MSLHYAREVRECVNSLLVVFLRQPRQNLINAASKVGDASHDIMYHVEPDSELDSAYKVKILHLLRICICTT